MPKRPNPDGWQGGSEDFTYLRQGMEGHIVASPHGDDLPLDQSQNSVTLDTIGLTQDTEGY